MKRISSPSCRHEDDGALYVLEAGMRCNCEKISCELDWVDCKKAVPNWTLPSPILNVAGQKYTIGSGANSNNNFQFNSADHGQFLVFNRKADVNKVHCQILCDENGSFWLQSLGYAEVFLNGKLIEVALKPVKLKFGDVFYFSDSTMSQLWSPSLTSTAARQLYRTNKAGKSLAVFKFERLTPRSKLKARKQNSARKKLTTLSTTNKTESANFLKTEPDSDLSCNTRLWEGVILSNIFEHLAKSCKKQDNYEDLLNCRLVSKSWKQTASLTLQKHYIAKFSTTMDKLIYEPNGMASRFLWFTHRMNNLKFDHWKVDVWPARYMDPDRDNEDRRVAFMKFKQDFSTFIQHDNFHPIKTLDINVDYFPPIRQLVSKFPHCLEKLTIQINELWMRDEVGSEVIEIQHFPRLKSLEMEFVSMEENDLTKLFESKWMGHFMEAVSGIEHLVMTGYAKLPFGFKNFHNLKKIILTGNVQFSRNLLDMGSCLADLSRLPKDQLHSFSINTHQDNLGYVEPEIRSQIEESLLILLERQANSLEKLEIFTHQGQAVRIPRRMPKLDKLWISYDTYMENLYVPIWGIKLHKQVANNATSFPTGLDTRLLPIVSLSTKRSKRCDIVGAEISLAFGKWDLIERAFLGCIPNVERMWTWA